MCNRFTIFFAEDGQFLIPDGTYIIPVKSSKVDTYAELITHWTNYTSTLSRSINAHAGLNIPHIGISGSFSDEYKSVKSEEYRDSSDTVRVQVSSKMNREFRFQVDFSNK